MAASWEFDESTRKGTLQIKKGGQISSTRKINNNLVNFDSGGEVVSVVFPNPTATVNLAGIPFKGSDHDDARRVMEYHRIKSGG